MPTLEVRSHISVDELLNGVAQLDTDKLDQFVSEVLTLRAKRVAPGLPEGEARLLRTINQGLPTDMQQRYEELEGKRRAETLAPEEREELLAMTDRVERADAERVQALGELAQLRGVPVPALMAELGIRPPAYA